jgi:hypothetical protein
MRFSSGTFGLPPRDREFHRQNSEKPALQRDFGHLDSDDL